MSIKNISSKIHILGFVCISLLLVACGTDDAENGAATPPQKATIDANNSETIMVASLEGVKANAVTQLGQESIAAGLAQAITPQLPFSGRLTLPGIPECDGNIGTMDFSGDQTNGTFTFVDFCIDIPTGVPLTSIKTTLSGAINFSVVGNNVSIGFMGLTVALLDETFILDADVSVNIVDKTIIIGSVQFKDSDGVVYSSQNFVVAIKADSNFDNFTVTSAAGTIILPNNEYVTITTNADIVFDCPNGKPSSGAISAQGAGETASITFNDCATYTVNYNGVDTVYSWPVVN